MRPRFEKLFQIILGTNQRLAEFETSCKGLIRHHMRKLHVA